LQSFDNPWGAYEYEGAASVPKTYGIYGDYGIKNDRST
jgi:hypothetical protein